MGEYVWEEDTFSEIKEKVVEENRKYWANKRNITQGDKWIYVYHGMSQVHFNWAVHEDIVAKGLQEKTGLPITSVIDGFGRALPEDLDKSFGIMESTHLFYSKYINSRSEETTYAVSEKMAKATYGDKDKLLQLEYRGIKFGDELYDHLILKNWQDNILSFDCFDISMERYAHYIRAALSLIDHTFDLFEQKCPAYVITTESLQLKRLFGDIAKRFGAEEMILLSNWPKMVVRIPAAAKDRKTTVSDTLGAVIQHYIKHSDRNGPETEDNLFLSGSSEESKFDFSAQLGISNNNMNVFILPHAFADVARENGRLHFYHDYPEWFLKTIDIIKNIPNVNWIIKDHPMTAFYKQAGYVKSVFTKNQTSNMYWCDSSVSGADIRRFADCVITCGGDAALEYWAYRIPTITTAVTYFTDLGISYNMKSEEAYKHMLENLADLKKPSKESSKKAQEILSALKQMSSCDDSDELVSLCINTRRKQGEGYRSGLSFRHIHSFCEGYLTLLERGVLEESCIYQMRNVCEMPV